MRILIVGAGVAGLTLAALLKQRGVVATVIEKAPSFGHVGYMIGLYPLGSKVFHGLGCYQQFLDQSIPTHHYEARTENGELLKAVSMQSISQNYGDYQTTTRYDLLDVIAKQCAGVPMKFSTTVKQLTEHDNNVEVEFSDGSKETYDLVVGADGLHSQIRSMILNSNEVEFFDTGWGGWVWWSDKMVQPADTVCEYWGDKRFCGTYPVLGNKVGVIAAVPYSSPEKALQGKSRYQYITEQFAKLFSIHPELLDGLPKDDQAPLFFWPLMDVRTKRWASKRVILLGDAAAGFLPTAGVGASMAMESAAALNDVLSRTDALHVPQALQLFVKRRKQRVEDAQTDSRKLSKLMFVKSFFARLIRDYSMKYMSAESIIKSIVKDFDKPI